MVNEFYYDSCGAGQIHAFSWKPEGMIRGIVQIVHGIAEHAGRYADFAGYLNSKGVLVVAEDHMGHGLSVGMKGIQGYFHGGWFAAVDDTMQLMRQIMQEYPGVPYVLFGHSMGSFMTRSILAKYPDCGISGAVICGTAWQGNALLKVAVPLSKAICHMDGETKPSKKLQAIMFGNYNKRVEHVRTENDWLTRDDALVDAYNNDPVCGFAASAGLYRDMLLGIDYVQQMDNLKRMNKTLPVHFVSGGDDPVGNYGEGVKKAVQMFTAAGMEQVTCKLYPMCRHEILNEINRSEVYEDLLEWLNSIFNSTN